MVKHARKKQKLSKDHKDLSVEVIHDDANKDDEERRLESLLFGTSFVESANGNQGEDEEADSDGPVGGGNEFSNLLDGDLFFVDDGGAGNDEEQIAGPSSASSSSESSVSESESDSDSSSSSRTSSADLSVKKKSRKSKASAWIDPSDPTTVSLSSKRLRKLRDAPHEEELHGREYESRLRRQFERINPEPTWAAQARKSKAKERRQAWADDEDEAEGGEDEEEDDSTDIQHLLASTSGVLRSQKSKRLLQAGTIDIARLRDANQDAQEGACGDIKSLAFHPSPTIPVLAVGSKDRRVRLYTIDGHLSPLLQTVHIPSLPLTSQSSVQFHPGGTQILLTGSRPFFYVYDLQSGTLAGGAGGAGVRGLWGTRWDDPSASLDSTSSGRKRGRESNQKNSVGGSGSGSMDVSAFSPTGEVLAVAGRGGYVHLVDWKTSASTGGGAGQVIGSLKCSSSGGPSGGGVKGMWWVPPSADEGGRTHLAILSGDSEVYLWDVGERRCLRRWKDEGGFRGSARVFAGSMASPRGGLLSVGSTSGLVNMYDSSAFAGSLNDTKPPKPIKTLSNLITPISTMRYNPDGQVLAVASREKKDALKLYHTNSLTTYANWPTSGTPLGHVTSIDFSAGSEYLAIGNTKGRVLLFSLKDYCT